MEFQNYILGIDFGTTYSCIAVWKDGGLVIIPNGIGERTTPSVVIFDAPDKIFVGEETLSHLPQNDSVKIYEIKRLLGKRYDQIQDTINYLPYKIIKENNGTRPVIEMTFGKKSVKFYPEQIATLIFRKLITNAENFLSHKIREVLITVPADFTEVQKNSVRYSAEQIQGLKVLQVINEPSAAILAYGFPRQYFKNRFYHFNHYSSLVNPSNEIHPMEEMPIQDINSTNSDQIIKSNTIKEQNSLINENDDSKDNLIINIDNTDNNIINNCSLLSQNNQNKMKIIVFDFGGGTYDVSLIYVDKDKNFETMAYKGDENLGGSDFDNKLIDYCLKDFCSKNNIQENAIRKNYRLMQRLKRACEETKKILSTKTEDIIFIEDFFETKPLCCHITRDKFEELCKDLFQRLIAPLDLILEEKKLNNTDIDEIIFVGGSSKIPKVKEIIEKKFPKVPINDQISPDEAVAYGACIYGESLRRIDGDFWKDFNYIDKTGHSYGIEVEDGTIEVIIPKGTRYPTSKNHFFETAYDNQYTFDIKVFEGEKKYAYENEEIGKFTLEGIPKKPKGGVILKVTMKIEKNQSIKITALVQEGNVKKNLTINRNNQYPKIQENENIILKVNELNIEEREIQSFIFEYSKNFVLQKDDKEKYELIKKYNSAIIRYLNFFEKNYGDSSSEKYLYLLEKLFKSYAYLFNTTLNILVDLNEKKEIKISVESYLKKICVKAPFRIKQLLNYFKNVGNDIFVERLEIAVFSMELIYNKAIENFNKNEKNRILLAKTLFEECLSIDKSFIKDEEHGKMIFDILKKYNDIKKDSDKKIKLISAISLSEIEDLKVQGKLFNNKNKLEKDDLNLLSFNLDLAIKKLNTIENLNENQEALETKSFYLANIVKIDFLKKEENMNLELMEQNAQESMSIAKSLKKDIKSKPWFKEIVKLYDDILKKKNNKKPAPPAEIKEVLDIDELHDKFMSLLEQGNEVLLKYILKNYPYNGYKYDEKSIEDYKKDKVKFLYNLRKKYGLGAYIDIISVNTNTDDMSSQINDLILEYIDKMIDKDEKE